MGFDTDSLRKLRSHAWRNTWIPELCSARRFLSQCTEGRPGRGRNSPSVHEGPVTADNFKTPEAAAGQYFGDPTTLWCRVIEKFAPGLVFLYLPVTTFLWSSNLETSSNTVLQAHAAYLHREELRELVTNGPKPNKWYFKKNQVLWCHCSHKTGYSTLIC